VEATLDALDHYYERDPQLFVRGNRLTEVVRDEQERWQLRQISTDSMIAHLDRAAEYIVYQDQGPKVIFPPALIVRQILARSADQVPFPPLTGIVKSPIMRANGTVLERATAGYDTGTRYYCAMDPAVASLDVPMVPTAADVASSLALLKDLVCDICFADPRDVYLANYIAILLTPLVRLLIADNLPLFAIDATKPRSGKGLLAAIVGVLANGYSTPVTTGPEPNESGEWRKKITTFLLAAENIITIDNIVFNLNSAELCALVTTRNYTDRILGSNTYMTADPLNSMWIFTGNALQPVGDLVKRCFWVRLDPKRSDPEKRGPFQHEELLSWAAASRAPLLRALLTLVRSWVVAGQPKPQGIGPFGGFDRWVYVVGGTLQHAGLTDFFKDPEQAYTDPDAEQWLPFLQVIKEVTYNGEFTVAELAKIVEDVQFIGGRNVPSSNAAKVREHLPDELIKAIDSDGFRAALGYAFRRKKNTYYGPENIHIAHTGKFTSDKAVLWQVRLGSQAQAPIVGEIRYFKGKPYRFDGKNWVKE
jgi:hypothetical protein